MKVSWFVKEAFISLKRNWVMSLAAIATVTLSLFVAGIFAFIVLTLNELVGKYEKQVEIKVFLKDTADPATIQKLQDEIVSWQEIEVVLYVSKEEALERFKQHFKDQPDLIENLPGNPLPASFEIRLKDPQLIDKVAARFDGRPEVYLVEYGKAYVEKFFQVIRVIRYTGTVFIALLSFVSVVLIVLTIRLAIFARRQEIAIMRLVGASNWFIRLPFVIEGCVQGILGALFAGGAIYILKVTFFEKLKEQVLWLPISLDITIFWQVMFGILLGGLAIGAFGSGIALRRFLKV